MEEGFDAWEAATAKYLAEWTKSPLVLAPAGAMLTAAMKIKAAQDRALGDFWGNVGLPTKRDQERALHKLNQLESKLLDLEEKLEALETTKGR
jgi:hypothetical protein